MKTTYRRQFTMILCLLVAAILVIGLSFLYLFDRYAQDQVRILPIGAFVEIAPGHDGMVHISKLENRRVEKVEDVLNVGDMTWVKFMGFDEKGRANFSRKDALKEIAEELRNWLILV